jgi:adenylate kinase
MYLYKAAWSNDPALFCYGEGQNILPCIHLDDLVNITVEVIETTPETKYLVAVDDSKSSLFDITKAVSEALGSGVVKKVDKEEAFLNKDLSQSDYDMLTCSLKIDATHVKEMSFEWKYEVNLI